MALAFGRVSIADDGAGDGGKYFLVDFLNQLWGDCEALVVVVAECAHDGGNLGCLAGVVTSEAVKWIHRCRVLERELAVVESSFDYCEMMDGGDAYLALGEHVALAYQGGEASVHGREVVLEREVPRPARDGRCVPGRLVGRKQEFIGGSG